ncbi:MAG: hypothetical protein M1524_04265 [Patescibacteria group bacterium]|nr:hypothetical protein [Patescibacteria group bacterium]
MTEKIEENISEVASQTEVKPEEIEKNFESVKPPAPKFPLILKILIPVLLIIVAVVLIIVLNPFKKLASISSKPTPTPTKAVPTPTPTSVYNSWKTYKNEEYGFEFKYPPTGIIYGENTDEDKETQKECGKAIKEGDSEITVDNFYTIQVLNWTDTIDQYLLVKGAKDKYDFSEIKNSNADEAVKVGDIKQGLELTSVGYPPLMYIPAIYKYNNKLFVISQVQTPRNTGGCLHPILVDPAKYQDSKNEKWDIAKTFKFSKPTPSFKTYTNDKYGFQITYPSRGVIAGGNETIIYSEGECGKYIKEAEPSDKSVKTEIAFDNFFSIRIIDWNKSINDYVKEKGRENFYDLQPINGSNADEAIEIKGVKPDAPKEILWGGLDYVKDIYKKGNNLFIIMSNQNYLNNGCISPSMVDPVKYPGIKNDNWDISTNFKFIDQGQTNNCVDKNTNAKMSYAEGYQIAQKSVCVQSGKLKESHICNENTGTWWIDLDPSEPKSGCNPACVVDVNTKKAEVNWRCTGLLQQ